MGLRRRVLALACGLVALGLVTAQGSWLGRPSLVADGVRLYRVADPSLLDPPARVAVFLLRLDPARVELRSVLAGNRVVGTATVLEMSREYGALAGVNGGFFGPSGDPAGLLKLGGELVSDARRPRGAVGVLPGSFGPFRLIFDRVAVEVSVRFETPAGEQVVVAAALDAPRPPDRLTVYTPRYAADTGTEGGVEWVLRGRPLRVVERRMTGRTPIPPDGLVLSFAGEPEGTLASLTPGRVVHVVPTYRTALGSDPSRWHSARDAVGGAGLLLYEGRALEDWASEGLSTAFVHERHPRTLIGADRRGDVWLAVVDGRQPDHSLGMTLPELSRLAARLGLREALNLDGGGSSTLVVRDEVVNRPSDAQGLRRVSDALLVFPRPRPR